MKKYLRAKLIALFLLTYTNILSDLLIVNDSQLFISYVQSVKLQSRLHQNEDQEISLSSDASAKAKHLMNAMKSQFTLLTQNINSNLVVPVMNNSIGFNFAGSLAYTFQTLVNGSNISAGFGLTLIVISLSLLWANERKQVKICSLTQDARNQMITDVQVSDVKRENNFKLVHCKGSTASNEIVVDAQLNLNVRNCVKLARKVQMFQNIQVATEFKDENGEKQVRYDYVKQWSDALVNSNQFKQPLGNENPNKMPYSSKITFNDTVYVGEYLLSETQLNKLNDFEGLPLNDEQQSQVMKSLQQQLKEYGYSNPSFRGTYFVCRQSKYADENQIDSHSDKIGDLKISWQYVPTNQKVVIIAQQMENEKNQVTFRQWNPKLTEVAWDDLNSTCIVPSCYEVMQMLTNNFDKGLKHSQFFKEALDIFETSERTPEEIFQEMEVKERTSTIIFRVFSWFFNIFGHFLLMIPLIAKIDFIPFVVYLLKYMNSVAAAFLFSLIYGSAVFTIVLSIKWTLYRPVYAQFIIAVVLVILVLSFDTVGQSSQQTLS